MILSELKEWVNGLPEEFKDFEVVNGEEGELDGEYWYRLDKPIISAMVDEENKEVYLLNMPAHESIV